MELVCAKCGATFPAPQDEDGVHVVTVFDLTVFQQSDKKLAIPICPACTGVMLEG